MADQDTAGSDESGFDAESTRRIVALAGWLQTQQLDQLSRDQLKEIAAEVGIEPRYIDASIQALEESRGPLVRPEKQGWLQRSALWVRDAYAGLARRSETRPFIRAGLLGVTAWVVAGLYWFLPLPVQILCWIALGIAAIFEAWRAVGFRRGLVTAAIAHLSFVTLLLMSGILRPGDEDGMTVAFVLLIPSLLTGGVAGAIGYGNRMGKEQKRLANRQEMLRHFYHLQDQLNAGAQRWTYLSVDVAGSTALKSGADALAIEFTFAEFHRHVAHQVAAHGGRVHSTSGDGTIAMFGDERSAIAAADAIQDGMLIFNQSHNRLGRPLVVRAGIHSGQVLAPGGDPAQVQFSEVIDHASHLQQAAPPGGVAISHEALTRAGPLPGIGALPAPVDGDPAFAWVRGAQVDVTSALPGARRAEG